MPRKNKEEYNTYMRNYMKKKNREIKGQPVLDDDFDPSAASEGKPVLDITKTGELVKETQELLKSDKSDSDAETDPVLKVIDKYGKYIPLVVEFMKGLKGSLPQLEQADNSPKAPEGWLSMSPMQKLNYKYSRSEWYAAGEAYDQAIESNYTNPAINIKHVDPNYEAHAPQNLQDLSSKYPEAPLINDSPPKNPAPVKEKPVETPIQQPSNSDVTDAPQDSPVVEDKTGAEADIKSAPAADKQDPIIAELQADNLKYLNLGSDYINELSDAELIKHLKDFKILEEKLKVFISLLPVHVKGMIFQTTKENLEELFKEKCPKKYKMIVKQKKVKKLLDFFEKFKTAIK